MRNSTTTTSPASRSQGGTPLPAADEQGWLEHDGARIWHASFGHGPAVVLLHGGLGLTATGATRCRRCFRGRLPRDRDRQPRPRPQHARRRTLFLRTHGVGRAGGPRRAARRPCALRRLERRRVHRARAGRSRAGTGGRRVLLRVQHGPERDEGDRAGFRCSTAASRGTARTTRHCPRRRTSSTPSSRRSAK